MKKAEGPNETNLLNVCIFQISDKKIELFWNILKGIFLL